MKKLRFKFFNILMLLIYAFSLVYFIFISENIMNISIVLFCIASLGGLYFLKTKNIIAIDSLYYVLNLFILFASLLGTCFEFYGLIHKYDDFLHIWSGFIGVSVAFSLIITLNSNFESFNKSFILVYLFMFSMGIASLWEISEFLIDTFLGMNTQVGGLNDTMMDIIDAFIGSSIMVIIYYFSNIKNIGENNL